MTTFSRSLVRRVLLLNKGVNLEGELTICQKSCVWFLHAETSKTILVFLNFRRLAAACQISHSQKDWQKNLQLCRNFFTQLCTIHTKST